MRHSRLLVFSGAIAALGLMTVLSGKKGILNLRVRFVQKAVGGGPSPPFWSHDCALR